MQDMWGAAPIDEVIRKPKNFNNLFIQKMDLIVRASALRPGGSMFNKVKAVLEGRILPVHKKDAILSERKFK
jgi:hypothetical protein